MKRRRWWLLSTVPGGAILGYIASKILSPPLVAVALVALGVLGGGVVWLLERRFTARVNEALARLARPTEDA